MAGAIGYIVTFVLIGRQEPDATIAATFGVIPLAVGIGFFVDHALIRRDAKVHGRSGGEIYDPLTNFS